MSSVAAVFSADFRAGLSQPQNTVPEGDDAFSDLLHSIADAKDARRPDGPRVPERRADAPARPPKPEADPERQAKRRAPDEAKVDGNPTTNAPVSVPLADDEEKGDAGTDNADADALLMLGLAQTQQEVPTAAAQGEAGESEAEALAVAAPPAAAEAEEAAPPAATPFQARLEAAAGESAPPKISAETPSSRGKLLPLAAAPEGEVQTQTQNQAQTQSGTASGTNAQAAQNPAPLEMLNAAISKHAQLALGANHDDPKAEAAKPLLSSNAVAPNFAMTAQAETGVTAQTPAAAESARGVPVAQLAVEIATRAGKGERRFDIRLDPPELGRIDVRLEIDGQGKTTTKLIVERAETLDMLQRDARGLEKALQNAGLKTDAGGLQFSLQQDAQMQQGQYNHAPELRGRVQGGQAETEIITEIATGNAALAAQLRGGVDIRI